ncbi:MAG: carbamoyltransferase HypF [Oscillospiraceae bacterium]|nr:carbamoyltransferase HypF [Oscillospiraceae bacterium]
MERALIKIHGIVQGVGFRPFIHRLVRDFGLKGTIKNTSSGVELELDGEKEILEKLVREIPHRAPALAVIEAIEAQYGLPCAGFESFTILASKQEAFRNTLISPDICICDDCLREMMTQGDRRYHYPFINCTNCGPRFTIIKDVPYDRAKTSMSAFPMCAECDAEYHDIENRRYHAQPDACSVCGPVAFFADADGKTLSKGEEAIAQARALLCEGKILAVKGLGGMHLACCCDDPAIARELRRRKQRDEKPFAIMCRTVSAAQSYCEVTPEEAAVLSGKRRPIVLLRKKPAREAELKHLSENRMLGVMLPYTPLHYLLFGDEFDALVMTSANLSDTPILYRNEEAVEKLHGIADGFLLHNREIQTRCDDSLCMVLGEGEYFLRRSRGYVPYPVRISDQDTLPSVLACGAEQKASFCLTKGGSAFPCQHIGDLKNFETFEHYQDQIQHFKRLFDIEPQAVACDLHPDYLSGEYAHEVCKEEHLPLYPVQHHHAHLASCMADNRLDGTVIGLIWDGTGLGTDGNIWGGECLTGGYSEFQRFGSLRPISLIGGDRAIMDLDRIAYVLLREAGKNTARIENAGLYQAMLASGLNCPQSSGMGRLFDGVASVLNVKNNASYEGQGAVLLEAAAGENETDVLPFDLTEQAGLLLFDWRKTIASLAEEKEKGTAVGVLAARFMNTLIEMAVLQCKAAREATGLSRVVLSGGSFQNRYMMQRLPQRLQDQKFDVYRHKRVSCNDEGLSLGQAAVALYQLGKGNYVSGSST